MSNLRLAVIGCGHLGRIHARLATQLDGAELVAICDPDQATRQRVSGAVGCAAVADHRDLLADIDAAILAVPTSLHCKIASELIQQGIHVLVEKPITTNLKQAERLAVTAQDHRVVLAVGHVEQFNPTFAEVRQHIKRPRFIEAVRTGGFTFRSTDVGVVFDLMIHDLDLIRSLAGSSVVHTAAVGISMLTQHEDFAEARLDFANGCIAHLKASRTSQAAQRQMTVYEDQQTVSMDLGTRTASIMRRSAIVQSDSWNVDRLPADQADAYKAHVFDELLPVQELVVPENNPLKDEQQDFVDSIRHDLQPRVSGQDALESVQLAVGILQQIQTSGRSDPRRLPAGIRRAA